MEPYLNQCLQQFQKLRRSLLTLCRQQNHALNLAGMDLETRRLIADKDLQAK
jgi:hypothetical protein